jgi:hypothetical protein
MRKAHIAELILSLFTSRERAASIVGDLIENATGGAIWFWSCVFRTALSLLWSDLADEPAFIAGLGFRGLLLNLSLNLALFISIVILSVIFGVLVGSGLVSGPAGITLRAFWVLGAIAVFTVNFQTGQWIARRARGREMAACIAFVIIQTIVLAIGELLFRGMLVTYLQNPTIGAPQPRITGVSIMITQCLAWISLLAGAIRVRSEIAR